MTDHHIGIDRHERDRQLIATAQRVDVGVSFVANRYAAARSAARSHAELLQFEIFGPDRNRERGTL